MFLLAAGQDHKKMSNFNWSHPDVFSLKYSDSKFSQNTTNLLSINLQAPCVLFIGQAFRYSPENAFLYI